MSKTKNRGAAWTPAASVTFKPVPHKLLPVTRLSRKTRFRKTGDNEPAIELVDLNFADKTYAGVEFDPWAKGDIVVVDIVHHAYTQPGAPKIADLETWQVMYRASTPAQKRERFANSADGDLANGFVEYNAKNTKLWRIPYRFRAAAAKLVRVQFRSREELEAAIETVALRAAA